MTHVVDSKRHQRSGPKVVRIVTGAVMSVGMLGGVVVLAVVMFTTMQADKRAFPKDLTEQGPQAPYFSAG